MKTTDGGGTITYLPTSVQSEQNTAIPTTFKLEQNFPNPFNPRTTINYQLPRNTKVSLRIYNLNGQMIKSLVNSKQTMGSYAVTWDGKDEYGKQVASGLYIYAIKTKEFEQKRKMLFVR